METLKVLLNNKLVGNLYKTRKGAQFKYYDNLSLNFPVLSTSLPVKNSIYKEGLTGNWFSGLLPEGRRLEELAKLLSCDIFDYFEILKNVGYECAGAVQIVPNDYKAKKDNITLHRVTEDELSNIIINNQFFETVDDEFWRISIGGFQDKICVTYEGDSLFLPNKGAISTHILKPEMNAYPGIVESEAWATCVASCVTESSNVKCINIKGLPVLRVERYDRKIVDGQLTRIHQEDFCQACGLNTSLKYANPREVKGTDPTYKKFAELLFSYSVDPLTQIQILAKQMVVNFCLGNYDAHAKNYSILHDNNHNIVMSPMYDVVPIAEVEPRTKYLSIRINGQINSKDVTYNDLVQEINSWGLPIKISRNIINECFDLISDGLRKASKLYPKASDKHKKPTENRLTKSSS